MAYQPRMQVDQIERHQTSSVQEKLVGVLFLVSVRVFSVERKRPEESLRAG